MEFDYSPIDYSTWVLGNKARDGINFQRLNMLLPPEEEIFRASVKYQDQRNDPGHGEMTAYFAIKLLDHLSGNREIAVPAATLHDIGWYGQDPDEWKKLVEKNKYNLQLLEGKATRRPHQNRGALLSGVILKKQDISIITQRVMG